MKGYRTLIFNAVSFAVTFGGIILQYVGSLGLTDKEAAIAALVVNAVVIGGNIYLRSITTTPMGQAR